MISKSHKIHIYLGNTYSKQKLFTFLIDLLLKFIKNTKYKEFIVLCPSLLHLNSTSNKENYLAPED